jgi:dynein heavy chain, axonemal
MEALEECLFMDKVPPSWEKRAYPSLLPLAAWHADLLRRLRELESWVSEFQVNYNLLTKNTKSLQML